MKTWRKTRGSDFGFILLQWRAKSAKKFFMKIFTWLLSAFVFGILTSIAFAAIGAVEQAQPAARLVFWIVFIGGIISAYVQNVYNGLDYRIYQNAFVHVKPILGIDKLTTWLGSEKQPFVQKLLYIPWNNIQEIGQDDDQIILTLKDERGNLSVESHSILSYTFYDSEGHQNTKATEQNRWNPFSVDEKLTQKAQNHILSKLREAKKQYNTI